MGDKEVYNESGNNGDPRVMGLKELALSATCQCHCQEQEHTGASVFEHRARSISPSA